MTNGLLWFIMRTVKADAPGTICFFSSTTGYALTEHAIKSHPEKKLFGKACGGAFCFVALCFEIKTRRAWTVRFSKLHLLVSVLTAFLFFSLLSCKSTNTEGIPYWYYRPQSRVVASEMAFIGEGHAAEERQALLLAYSDLNRRLYAYLGENPSEEAYRELSTRGTISRFSLRVADRYVVRGSDSFSVYLLAVAGRESVQGARSPAALQESEIASQARSLILEGDDLMKAGYDTQALKKYLQSMVLTYPLTQIDEEYSFPVMLDEVLGIISTTRISLHHVDTENASCHVRVRRRDTTIPTRISNAAVKASFTAEDARGEVFTDTVTFVADVRGDFDYSPKNNLMNRRGRVSFYLDVEEELADIAAFSPQAVDRIRSAVASGAVGFEYSLRYKSISFVICPLRLEDSIRYVPDKQVGDALSSRIRADGIACRTVSVGQEMRGAASDIDELDSLVRDMVSLGSGTAGSGKRPSETSENRIFGNADEERLVVARVSKMDEVSSRNGVNVCTLQTRFAIYDSTDGKALYNSGMIYVNGWGSSPEEAEDEAYSGFVNTVYAKIKNIYF